MNKRTAKQIKRFSLATGMNYKRTKRTWNSIRRDHRVHARIGLVAKTEEAINDREPCDQPL